jgi:ribosomal protein L34
MLQRLFGPDRPRKTPGFWDIFGDAFARSAPKAVTTQKLLQVIEHVLEFEKLSPASTRRRLHNYILRNYTEEGRRVVYHRAKRRQAMPPVVYNVKFYESAIRAAQGGDRRCKLRPEQVSEMRQVHEAGKASMRQLAKRYSISVSTVSNIIKRRFWKD